MAIHRSRARSGSAKEELASGWSSWHQLRPPFVRLAHHSAMGMTAHLLDDTFITARELAKGSEVGGLEGNPGKELFAQIHLEV